VVGEGIKIFRRFAVLVTVVALGALSLGGTALAQTTPGGYRGAGTGAQQKVQSGVQSQSQNQQQPAARTIGSLPFTGLDLAVAVGGGLLLVVAGTALRRSNKRTSTT
jgi:hypothetical protein